SSARASPTSTSTSCRGRRATGCVASSGPARSTARERPRRSPPPSAARSTPSPDRLRPGHPQGFRGYTLSCHVLGAFALDERLFPVRQPRGKGPRGPAGRPERCGSGTTLERGSMATKAELIDAVAASAGVTKADAERTIGAFFDHVTTATKKDKVSW